VSVDAVKYAFALGAPKVVVSGCHPGDCHYLENNLFTEKRITKLKKSLKDKGINPDRLALEWVSASEGQRFAEVIHKMETLEVDEADVELGKMIFGQPKKKKKSGMRQEAIV
jgi:heterodisulfide reductase subunit A